jgi:hypothetical protein
MWWIVGGIVAVVLIAFVALALWVWQIQRAGRAERAMVFERGRRVYGYIVKAEPELYKQDARPLLPFAGIVYTFDQTIPDLPRFLQGVAERILAMQDTPGLSEEEQKFMRGLRPNFYGHVHPERVPQRAAGDVAVFLVAVQVWQPDLPAKRLDRPYLYAMAVEGDENLPVFMLPYSDAQKAEHV